MTLDRDLTAYYAEEARLCRRTSHSAWRFEVLDRFAEQFAHEDRQTVADVGAGPGVDTRAWVERGFDAVAVDLTHANSVIGNGNGHAAITGSIHSLPLRSEWFDAVWSMSTFVHVPMDETQAAVGELLRIARPGAPVVIGTWGGVDHEGVIELGDIVPYRFFSLATHDRWRELLATCAPVDTFEVVRPDDPLGWEYQVAVLRRPM